MVILETVERRLSMLHQLQHTDWSFTGSVVKTSIYVAPAATYRLVVHWQCCQDVYLCCTSCNLPTGRSLAVLSRRLSMLHQLQPTDWSFTGSVVKTSIYVAPAATYRLVVHWQCCQDVYLCCTSCNLPTGRSLAVLSRRLSMLHQLQPTNWSFTGSVVKTRHSERELVYFTQITHMYGKNYNIYIYIY